MQGDFFANLAHAPKADLIFYDLYSSRTLAFAWTKSAFAAMSAASNPGAELITYSTSTSARVAMLAGGFWVARGLAFGVKTDTTVALVPGFAWPPRYPLLGQDWLAKWRRSQAKVPIDVEDRAAFEAFVEGHPQFAVS